MSTSAGQSASSTMLLIFLIQYNYKNGTNLCADLIEENLVQLPGNSDSIDKMDSHLKRDEISPFQEAGGYFKDDNWVSVPDGPIANSDSETANIEIKADGDYPTAHTHAEGLFENGRGFVQFPSKDDIKSAKNSVHYVYAVRQNMVYIYDRDGIKAGIDREQFLYMFGIYGKK